MIYKISYLTSVCIFSGKYVIDISVCIVQYIMECMFLCLSVFTCNAGHSIRYSSLVCTDISLSVLNMYLSFWMRCSLIIILPYALVFFVTVLHVGRINVLQASHICMSLVISLCVVCL